jgi:hypothetical protein
MLRCPEKELDPDDEIVSVRPVSMLKVPAAFSLIDRALASAVAMSGFPKSGMATSSLDVGTVSAVFTQLQSAAVFQSALPPVHVHNGVVVGAGALAAQPVVKAATRATAAPIAVGPTNLARSCLIAVPPSW